MRPERVSVCAGNGLVGVVVVDVGLLVAALDTGCDGVLGDVVVGVFGGHGGRDGGGDSLDGGGGNDEEKQSWEGLRGADIEERFLERVIPLDWM